MHVYAYRHTEKLVIYVHRRTQRDRISRVHGILRQRMIHARIFHALYDPHEFSRVYVYARPNSLRRKHRLYAFTVFVPFSE